MATALTTSISKIATQYELTAVNIAPVGGTVTLQVNLLDAGGNLIESKTFTKTFAELGISQLAVDVVANGGIDWLKAQGEIN